MKKQLIIALSVLSILAFGGGTTRIGQAASPNGLCLTEPEFTNYNAMTLSDIRQFLTDKGGFMQANFTDVDGVPVDAALEIYNAAQANKINPRVLIATLQKEGGAITRALRPVNDELKRLAGWDTNDNAVPLNQKSAREQIRDMGAQFRRDFYERLSLCQTTLGSWQVDVSRQTGNTPGQEKNPSNNTISVTPENKAIATLYQYTPWVSEYFGYGRTSATKDLIGGNGSFCKLWDQYGFSSPPNSLTVSQPNPTLICAPTPTPTRCVSLNASGGTPPYTWSSNKGARTVSGVDSQNMQLRPPANSGSEISGTAYTLRSFEYAAPPVYMNQWRDSYGCNDNYKSSVMATSCTCGGASCPATYFDPTPPSYSGTLLLCGTGNATTCNGYNISQVPLCSGNREVDGKAGQMFDERNGNGISSSCNPCRISMQGANVIVSDSTKASTTVPVSLR